MLEAVTTEAIGEIEIGMVRVAANYKILVDVVVVVVASPGALHLPTRTFGMTSHAPQT